MCLNCGMYNHRKKDCPSCHDNGASEPGKDTYSVAKVQGSEPERKDPHRIHPKTVENYGPWMMA